MPSNAAETSRFIVLPTRGLQATVPTSNPNLGQFLKGLGQATTLTAARQFIANAALKVKSTFRVLDAIHEDGAKLIEMTAETAKELVANQPGLRIVPEKFYYPARHRPEPQGKVKAAAAALRTVIALRSQADGKPIKGARVVAFTDFAQRLGAGGTTNNQGEVKLNLGSAAKIERLYVYGPVGFWGAFRKNVATQTTTTLKLAPVELSFTDGVRHYYGNAATGEGAGVTVGVVDTGVGPHTDLVVAGGANTVLGENASDFGDNGDGHGTHVAGIIAARGTPPTGLRGLAAGVSLRSYRVFGKGAAGASNFAIAKAIDRAVADGCDIVNLSLGGGDADPATASAIHDARQQGTLVVAAAGNDERSPVSFPAADSLCIAVSALGRKGTFPKGSVEEADVVSPFGTVTEEFIAAFSNVGPQIDLTGPGLGILSTVPGGYAPESGTSMACPAVAGFAARLLAGLPAVLAQSRDQARSDAIARALLLSAKSRGFPTDLQGNGLPLP